MKKVHSIITFIIFNFAFCFLINTACYATPKIDTIPTAQTLEVASLFKDHMVLQRDMPIPIWGKAQAGAIITVAFANSEKSTVADLNGKWRVDLDALKASFASRTMRISSSADKDVVQISDIVVGEVWICSGQSNMQMGFDGIPEIKALTTTASNIRSFNVKRTVAFEPQDSCAGEWVTEHPNSAVAFSFAHYLEKSANVPVGIILTAWGSSSLEAWMPRDMTQTVPHFKTMMEEFDADSETKTRIQSILDGPKPWPNQDDIFLRRQSNILYNAMIHPLIPFACRGLVWYQGERNTQSMQGMLKEPWYSRNSGMLKYGDALQEWVKRYRKEWSKNDFEFLVIMLPGFGKNLDAGKPIDPKSPAAHSWAWMRESQLKALELPHTSVINTIDLGDIKNIHPKDKLPIGKRLALVAIKNNGDKTTKANGPTLKRVTVKKGSLVVHFTNAKDLQTVDGKAPRSFWLADEAGQWFPAEARIKGKSVMLHCSQLKNPLYVRYAFVGKPDVNLVNDANLPAYPFRTDSIKP
ncbi:sialate O-acetylesterase [Cellulophaga sp. F20128]|uniref:sialate O-acetylesterase n=1 Tax=Cellulophaga sp. F20128 TaxID=2926413 RepID=UPI001FF56A32|nr:sialate O-acetylesterase [Cellulophaga sp. F20128]MCK0157308.1 sialate O-acetylesterase [Cellulophaga sp. F20128]